MKTYARVQDGIVAEIIPPLAYDIDSPEGVEPTFKAGDEVPITARYNAALIDGSISSMYDITNVTPQPEQNWTTADGKTYAPPEAESPTN